MAQGFDADGDGVADQRRGGRIAKVRAIEAGAHRETGTFAPAH